MHVHGSENNFKIRSPGLTVRLKRLWLRVENILQGDLLIRFGYLERFVEELRSTNRGASQLENSTRAAIHEGLLLFQIVYVDIRGWRIWDLVTNI